MSPRQELAAAVRRTIQELTRWEPIATLPKEGTITLLARPGLSCVGVYRDGQWKSEKGKPLPWEPTHWMEFDRGQT